MKGPIEKNPRIEADVQLLLGRFRDLVPNGRVVPHTEIEALLKMPRSLSRYRTVTKRWRRVVFTEQHVFLDGRSAQGEGFKALTPDDMIRYTHKEVRAIGRKLRNAIQVGTLPDPSELSTSTRLFQARLIVAIEQITSTHKHVLLDLTRGMRAPQQLPRSHAS